MRMATRLALGIALALTACGAMGPALPPDAVILPGSAAAEMLHQCSRQSPAPGESNWMPASGDIAVLEAALANALQPRQEIRGRHFPNEPDWARVPQGWRRQYVGIVRGGRRFIYGNFYPRRPDGTPPPGEEQWRAGPIVVCDGGPVFFGVEYDVEAGRFSQIAFNGGF
jgi:predicted small lipoprotein YifL